MAYKYSTKLMKIQQNYGIGKRMLWCIGENNGNMLPECSIFVFTTDYYSIFYR